MNNIWDCPHVVLYTQHPDETEELNTERQRIINALSNHINKLATQVDPNRKHKPAKNEALMKLPRSDRRKQKDEIDPTQIQVVKLSDNLSITVCNACYLAMREDIVIEILKNVREI